MNRCKSDEGVYRFSEAEHAEMRYHELMEILKSIGAVVAGFVAVLVLHTGTDFVMESSGIFPGASNPELYASWMLAVALAYRCVWSVLGGYITAWLAPRSKMKHVYALGIIGTLGGI